MELNRFLVKAKISTYATGGELKEKVLSDGSKEFTYENQNFRYRDRYFGHNPFVGQEIVWKDNELCWAMNYYGKVVSDEISTKEIYRFLKEALKGITKNFPFRGPKQFQKDKFEYKNTVMGDISSFKGKEIIYYNNKEIYFLYHHGGFI
ncbi:MAG: XRE family transcriptional regulator [Nanoarchaeota archaeon]|nr:XRE family transcriptional regulator [Nanoarchaeota archaeon]